MSYKASVRCALCLHAEQFDVLPAATRASSVTSGVCHFFSFLALDIQGESQGRCCKKHAISGMVLLKILLCSVPNCQRSAIWVETTDNRQRACREHRRAGVAYAQVAAICTAKVSRSRDKLERGADCRSTRKGRERYAGETNTLPLFSWFANRPSSAKIRARTVRPAVAPRAEAYFSFFAYPPYPTVLSSTRVVFTPFSLVAPSLPNA